MKAFGVDFDNMKCRGWVEAGIPMFIAETEAAQAVLQEVAGRLTRATEIAATALRYAVKCAIFATPEDASGDFTQVSGELWAATESTFYEALARLSNEGDGEGTHLEKVAFQRALATATLEVFDRWCPADSVALVALRRAVFARYGLKGTLNGHGKLGSKLFSEFEIVLPVARAKRSQSSRKKGGALA
jgi:CRISPR system Cascade subunit CasA